MKVLVTASTGLTGRAIVKAMASKNIYIRAMAHASIKTKEMLLLGAKETFVGDVASEKDLFSAMDGIDAIYYICPTAREDEAEIGKMAITVAKKAGVNRFIYQSVLHSNEPALPHHRRKLEVERALIGSGLNYTIVQPAPFMQNILNAKKALTEKSLFVQKFFTGTETTNRINLIDAEDFGQCVAQIALESQYDYATLELCGPENLSVSAMISDIEGELNKEVALRYISDDEFRKSMQDRNASLYSIETLLRMFHHYNEGDFCGCDFVATSILKRKPVNFVEFLKRELK